MITNYFNFIVNGKNVKLREISFYEFKNICKRILTDDLKDLNNIFNDVLNSTITCEPLNCLEKFQCLMILRNLIYGKEFTFFYDNTKIITDLTILTNNIKFNIQDIIVNSNNITFYFNSPDNFFTENLDDLLADCLKKIIINNKELNCNKLSLIEKKKLFNELSLPIFDTYKKLKNSLDDLNLIFYKDATINIYDGSLLLFLKRVYQEDMMNLYSFEYTCIRGLKLHAADMERYTYPELKIFLQELNNEMKKSSKQPSGVDIE